MRPAITLLLTLALLSTNAGHSQPCTSQGQTPSTAFPVCGTGTFVQAIVPLCGSIDMIVPCDHSDGAIYMDKNPYWYKFTCFSSGTLGLLITPMDLNDDYDWQIFDITGHNPNDVFTDSSLLVACNWSGYFGLTGTSPTATSLNECAGDHPQFSQLPMIQQGREYLLLVSHWTDTQTGYTLEFTGGTAVITDPLPPALLNAASVTCDGTEVTVRMNKKIKCNSLAANGSDFSISPSGSIFSASGYGCSTGFDLDSIKLILSAPLLPGNYTLSAIAGSDGNTLLDICATPVVPGDNVSFTILPGPGLPMGTVPTATCFPQFITLNFTDTLKCNSIAADGSDFLITGPSAVTISGATYICNGNGETNSIVIQFASQVLLNGTYQVQVRTGSDGNTLRGRCNSLVNAGANTSFVVTDAPVLMTGTSSEQCSPTSITIGLGGLIDCGSIAADGSDFVITGASPVTIVSATGNCINGMTDSITIQLSSPILTGGNYTLSLRVGTDGNTISNSCNGPTPPGSALTFLVRDAVDADFTYQVTPGCSPTDVIFTHNGANGVNSWTWKINGGFAGNLATCTRSIMGTNALELTVSNGFCTAIKTMTIDLPNTAITADFRPPDVICPGKPTYFINTTTGVVDNWLWDFGNGQISDQKIPALQQYPMNVTSPTYTIVLTASNLGGCVATKTKIVTALKSCLIAVPTGFTPNNDGLNDYLYPLNGFGARNLLFKVYNRWGQLVFETRNWTIKWDGKLNGVAQASGMYVWILDYVDRETGQAHSLKGKTMLIR